MLIVLPFSIDVGLKALVKNAESVKMKALVKDANHPRQSISEECLRCQDEGISEGCQALCQRH